MYSAGITRLELDIQQVFVGTEKLQDDTTTQYKSLVQMLSTQLEKTETIERSQQALIERIDSIQIGPLRQQLTSSSSPQLIPNAKVLKMSA